MRHAPARVHPSLQVVVPNVEAGDVADVEHGPRRAGAVSVLLLYTAPAKRLVVESPRVIVHRVDVEARSVQTHDDFVAERAAIIVIIVITRRR